MINKTFDTIGKEDLNALVRNEVPEGRGIEYKERLPDAGEEQTKEFLADVSSFANASGGDVVYGVKTRRVKEGDSGIPEAILGLAGIDVDKEIQRLESKIRDGIDPRIAGVRIKSVPGFELGPAILVRIPKSWAAPHMVVYRTASRFYSRNSRGKYPLDVREIRSAFLFSEAVQERIRRFRDERLARIVAKEFPFPSTALPFLVLHVVPVSAMDLSAPFPVNLVRERAEKLGPIRNYPNDSRYNFDGFISIRWNRASNQVDAYTQVFQHGAIEAVETIPLVRDGNDRVLMGEVLESELQTALKRYLHALEELGAAPPVFVMVTMFGVAGVHVTLSGALGCRIHAGTPIDRDALILPIGIAESFDVESGTILRQALDALWRASGWPSNPRKW